MASLPIILVLIILFNGGEKLDCLRFAARAHSCLISDVDYYCFLSVVSLLLVLLTLLPNLVETIKFL